MCGIAGMIAPGGRSDREALAASVLRMADTLVHRGPDDRGAWVDPAVGIAIGHRRLAIVDLSPEGAQPMVSACGRYVLAYNGEIYDFRETRSDLESLGSKFRGHSDTEVLLEAISRWGVEEAVQRCNGMFAFALWDRGEETLTLARDRVGKKPLYYGWNNGRFVFASELKALRAAPGFQPDVDRDALALFVRFSYVPAPHTIYRGVRKLRPGTLLRVRPGTRAEDARPREFWSARVAAERAAGNPYLGGDGEAADALESLLRDAISRRMIADVPVGATLSGGIDSSTVVALMQADRVQKVRTFSIGHEDPKFNEADHARAIAEHLGTDHTELTVTHRDALEVIPRLPQLYDEPFADVSQVPSFLVSSMARREVVVALSGDGGDELFAGYNRYFQALERWPGIARKPAALRRAAATILRASAGLAWGIAGARSGLLGCGKLERNAERIATRSMGDYYARRASRCNNPSDFTVGGREPPILLTDERQWAELDEPLQRLMTTDLMANLPDQFLVKVDRASMGVGLEVRSPLLDYRVVEFTQRLPMRMKVRDGERKWLLRKVLDRHVPRALTERPKQGFGAPFDSWMRGPLRDWVETLLDERRLREEGYLRARAVRRVWAQHLAGWRNHRFLLWNFLMFQAWLEGTR